MEGLTWDLRAIRGEPGGTIDSVEVIAEDLESMMEEVHADLVATPSVDLAFEE